MVLTTGRGNIPGPAPAGPASRRRARAAWLAIGWFALAGCAAKGPTPDRGTLAAAAAARDPLWTREELYFGADLPDGGEVSDSLWNDFLERDVVPRFPNGLTVLEGRGYYRYADGRLARERARMIVLLHHGATPGVEESLAAIFRA